MKSNLEKVSNLERKLKIEVPAAVVGASFNRVFQGIQKQANIKGFRPGKYFGSFSKLLGESSRKFLKNVIG
jgi:FKBP-type peptidyl-prolyl cis-trans isomerase (trigger factor)